MKRKDFKVTSPYFLSISLPNPVFVCWKHPQFQHLWLLPELKSAMKEQRFQDIEDIQKNVTTVLKVILT
jgi:hypothetical protein